MKIIFKLYLSNIGIKFQNVFRLFNLNLQIGVRALYKQNPTSSQQQTFYHAEYEICRKFQKENNGREFAKLELQAAEKT